VTSFFLFPSLRCAAYLQKIFPCHPALLLVRLFLFCSWRRAFAPLIFADRSLTFTNSHKFPIVVGGYFCWGIVLFFLRVICFFAFLLNVAYHFTTVNDLLCFPAPPTLSFWLVSVSPAVLSSKLRKTLFKIPFPFQQYMAGPVRFLVYTLLKESVSWSTPA